MAVNELSTLVGVSEALISVNVVKRETGRASAVGEDAQNALVMAMTLDTVYDDRRRFVSHNDGSLLRQSPGSGKQCRRSWRSSAECEDSSHDLIPSLLCISDGQLLAKFGMAPLAICLARILQETDVLGLRLLEPGARPAAHEASSIHVEDHATSEPLLGHQRLVNPNLPGEMLGLPEVHKVGRGGGGNRTDLYEGKRIGQLLQRVLRHIGAVIYNCLEPIHCLILRVRRR